MENNPEVTQQIMEIANNVTQRIMNERPELLMEAVKDPLSLLKKHKNPMKIMQMVKENPMSVLEVRRHLGLQTAADICTDLG